MDGLGVKYFWFFAAAGVLSGGATFVWGTGDRALLFAVSALICATAAALALIAAALGRQTSDGSAKSRARDEERSSPNRDGTDR